MPFKSEYDPVLAVIKQAAARFGLAARRIDEDAFTGSILSHMRKAIETSQYMVAILSEENGNVTTRSDWLTARRSLLRC